MFQLTSSPASAQRVGTSASTDAKKIPTSTAYPEISSKNASPHPYSCAFFLPPPIRSHLELCFPQQPVLVELVEVLDVLQADPVLLMPGSSEDPFKRNLWVGAQVHDQVGVEILQGKTATIFSLTRTKILCFLSWPLTMFGQVMRKLNHSERTTCSTSDIFPREYKFSMKQKRALELHFLSSSFNFLLI